jgi:hypothetical protein
MQSETVGTRLLSLTAHAHTTYLPGIATLWPLLIAAHLVLLSIEPSRIG